MGIKSRLAFIISLWLLIQAGVEVSYAQTYPYYHYTTDQGLPHSNVYCMVQDKEGFIWFGTENGLSRFDGTTFKNYSVADGLTASDVTGLVVTADNSLWLSIYDRDINRFKDGVITPMNLKRGQQLFFPYLAGQGGYLYSYNHKNFIEVSTEQQRVSEFIVNDSLDLSTVFVDRHKNVWLGSDRGLYQYHKHKHQLEHAFLPNQEVAGVAQGPTDSLWLGLRGGIALRSQSDKIRQFTLNIPPQALVSKLLSDQQGGLWYWYSGVEDDMNGLFLWKRGEIIAIGEQLGVNRTQINFIQEDNQGNIWVGTFGQGVYCLRNRFIKNYSVEGGLNNNYVFSVGKDGLGNILAGTFKGLNVIHDYQPQELDGIHPRVLQRHIAPYQGKDVFLTAEYGPESNKFLEQKIVDGQSYWYVHGSSIMQWSEDTLIVGGWGGLSWYCITENAIDLIGGTSFKSDEMGYLRVNKMYKDARGKLWVASNQGIGCWESGKVIFLKEHRFFQTHVNDITESPDGILWVVGDKGVATLEQEQWEYHETIADVPIYSATSITFDDQGGGWIGTINGLYNYDGENLKILNRQTGLLSNNINDIYYDQTQQDLWVGTSDGLSCINIKQFYALSGHTPKLLITEMINGGETFLRPGSMVIQHQNQSIQVRYVALDYTYPKALTYAYRLGTSGHWISTSGNNLELAALPFGKYQLQLRAKAPNSPWGTPQVCAIEVITPYWRSTWFIVLVIGITASLIFVGVRLRIQMIKRRARAERTIKEKVTELEHRAIAAMMNPHFIFNSLNTIQYFVNKNLLAEANTYLASFGHLIRIHLDVVERGMISIHEEVNRLTLYLKLEKIRFRDRLHYIISIAPEIDSYRATIPNMIIQPFVENAIKHGILPMEQAGEIAIDFTLENEQDLKITIKDNGVGFQNGGEASGSERSHAITLIEERLQLLFPSGSTQVSIDSQSSGTLITIMLPYTQSK